MVNIEFDLSRVQQATGINDLTLNVHFARYKATSPFFSDSLFQIHETEPLSNFQFI